MNNFINRYIVLVFNCGIYIKCHRYGHMIDNVVLIVTGTLHERDVQELLEKCHPLGMFDRYIHLILMIFLCSVFFNRSSVHVLLLSYYSIATLAVAQNMRELYRLVLVDTPLAPYFSECITSEVLVPIQFRFDIAFLLMFCYY